MWVGVKTPGKGSQNWIKDGRQLVPSVFLKWLFGFSNVEVLALLGGQHSMRYIV